MVKDTLTRSLRGIEPVAFRLLRRTLYLLSRVVHVVRHLGWGGFRGWQDDKEFSVVRICESLLLPFSTFNLRYCTQSLDLFCFMFTRLIPTPCRDLCLYSISEKKLALPCCLAEFYFPSICTEIRVMYKVIPVLVYSSFSTGPKLQ